MDRVVSDGPCCPGFDPLLVHGQHASGLFLRFPHAFIVATSAGAVIAKIRKIVATLVSIRPRDGYTLAGADVDSYICRRFSRVNW